MRWTFDEERAALVALARMQGLTSPDQGYAWEIAQELRRELPLLGWVCPAIADERSALRPGDTLDDATSGELRALLTDIWYEDLQRLGTLEHMVRTGVMAQITERASALAAEVWPDALRARYDIGHRSPSTVP